MKRMIGFCLVLSFLIALSACSYAQSDASDRKETEAEAKKSTASTEIASFAEEMNRDTEQTVWEKETVGSRKDKLLYMGQASIRITTAEGKLIYIAPYVGSGYEPAADLILVTHSHYDHNGVEKVVNRNPDCRIITWKEALAGGKHQTFDLDFATVEAVEAGYNRWHSAKECVGYIVTLSDGISIYVTGDTSRTAQMPALSEKNIDYAFYCCDGIFNMDLDEAAECAALVGARYDVPYHMLAQDGVNFDRSRAEQFESPNLLIIDEGEEIETTDLQIIEATPHNTPAASSGKIGS